VPLHGSGPRSAYGGFRGLIAVADTGVRDGGTAFIGGCLISRLVCVMLRVYASVDDG